MNIKGAFLYLARLVLAAALLSVAAVLAISIHPEMDYAPVWPATAMGLALMWRHGLRYWPAVFLANFVNAWYVGAPGLHLVTGSASVELLVALLALTLLRRYRVRWSLSGANHMLAFTVIAALASAPTVFVYPFVVVSVFSYPLGPSVLQGIYYWVSSFFSLMIFTPLLMSAHYLPDLDRKKRNRLLGLLGLTVLCGAAVAQFAHLTGHAALFMLLPFVVACSIVAGVGGASAAAFIVMVTMLLTERMVDPSPVATQIRLLFAATVIVTGYLLGTLWSDRQRIRRELEHRARHDALTGLMNRFELERRLQAALRGAPGQNALLYLDLDQFKLLNDTCGHMAGDAVLRELGDTLARALPPTANLARLGGDEFGCLITQCSEETARDIADTLRATIRDFRYREGDLQFSLGASIGLTWFSADNGDTVDSVLARADIACYVAKEEGRNHVHIYHPSDEKMLRRHSEIREVSQLQAALDSGRFELHAQRIVGINTNCETEHFHEVLLRLNVDGKQVSANDFLPVAYRYGMIGMIDRWVLERAGEFLGRQEDNSLRLSVNVSGATLDTPGFAERIAALPERHGFEARQLCLEVTESVAIDHLTRAVEGMRKLRGMGFDIALDDFGSGVASFGYLRELPVSLVKLDGRFVRDIGRDPAATLVVEALVKVAALRGIRCVAEWVEDTQALEHLRALGVHYAQGFLLHEPQPLASLGSRMAVDA